MQHLDQLIKDFEAIVQSASAGTNRPSVAPPPLELESGSANMIATLADDAEPHPFGGCMGGNIGQDKRYRGNISQHSFEATPRVEQLANSNNEG